MRSVVIGLLGGMIASVLAGIMPATAQESPTSAWGSVQSFKGPADTSNDLYRAEMIKRSRTGGYGPASASVNYYDEVTNTEYVTNNGPIHNSSSLNAVNYNEASTSVNQEGSTGATVGVTFSTGQTSYDAAQTAQSQVLSVGTGTGTQGSSAGTNR